MSVIYQQHGKVILLGEHAVLRGHGALVLPMLGLNLTLEVDYAPQFSVETIAPIEQSIGLLVESLAPRAWQLVHANQPMPTVRMQLSGNLPAGKGLGFSAAVCALLANWAVDQAVAPCLSVVQLSQTLEHVFHGVSSGVDVIGVTETRPCLFYDLEHYEALDLTWRPKLFLSLPEGGTRTAQCVALVNALHQRNPKRMALVDLAMRQALHKACETLTQCDENPVFLAEAMCVAQRCFNVWGLVDASRQEMIDALYAKGAIAVKLSGAGGAGCLLSLWATSPPKSLRLLPVF